MKEKNAPSLKESEVIFLSFFGVGFIKKAPGTFGTLAILPFLYLFGLINAPFLLFIPILVIATIISCFIAEVAQQKFGLHDPGWIVIDEVLGMTTAWLFIEKHSLLHLFILFILFRIFDIFKVWPATYFDKEVTHGMGTILDDIISGVFAGLVYLLLLSFFNI